MCSKADTPPPPAILSYTHKDIVLNLDEMTASQVGRRQGRDEQLLVLPVVHLSGPDLAPGYPDQLSSLSVHHLTPRQVVNRLKRTQCQV